MKQLRLVDSRPRGPAGLSVTATNDVAIKSLAIGGSVELAQILAGYGTALASKNADAQIGDEIGRRLVRLR